MLVSVLPTEAQDVLDLWFPPDQDFAQTAEAHKGWMMERMQGGMDEIICTRYAALTRAAAERKLDQWATTARGRLALILLLDQFPRSLWRDTPGAYAQDIAAASFAIEGVKNGHAQQLTSWERMFFVIAISHCEGPDHLARFQIIEDLTESAIADMPPALAHLGDLMRAQNARVRQVISLFGRHPHRNDVLGRLSTPDEQVYIAKGDFPHHPPRDI